MEKQYVIFKLADETYGVNINYVSEIIRMQAVTKIPKTIDFVEGVINLRGRVILIIDLKKQFSLGETEYSKDTRIIVVEMKNISVGLVVGEATEVLSLSEENIEHPSKLVSKVNMEFIQGIGKWKDNLIILLEAEKILVGQEIQQLNQLGCELQGNISSEVWN